MRKLYLRLAVTLVCSSFLISLLFLASLAERSKRESYSYLSQMLDGIQSNLHNVLQDYEEKLNILEKDYRNRAESVEYILSSDSQMISQEELLIVKELMEVQGIALTDSEGRICLAVGEQNGPKNEDTEGSQENSAVVMEETGFYDAPSYFYAKAGSASPYFSAVRLDAQMERLGLSSRRELIESTLKQATTEENTILAVIAKEGGRIAGITKNNSQELAFEDVQTPEELLEWLEVSEKDSLLLRKVNGEYHMMLIREEEGLYMLALTRLSGVLAGGARTLAEGLAGIGAVSLLTILMIHFHLKKYLFGQIEKLKQGMQRFLEGDYEVFAQQENTQRLPELQALEETLERLRREYIHKSEGISQMENQLSLARTEARFDQLTGLYNRNGFERCMEAFLNSENPSGILILFDLDNFKRINDSEGHPEGDRILVRFAECLRAGFRKSDYIGRLGGDEFTVLMPNPMPRDLLERKFQELLLDFRRSLGDYYEKYQVSVSIGAVEADGEIKSYEGLYRCADTALYIAKYMGKDQYYINDKKISCMKRKCAGCRKDCPRSRILKQNRQEERSKRQEQ